MQRIGVKFLHQVITVRFAQEHTMSTLITEMHSHAFDFARLAPSAQTEIRLAQQEAARMRAPEVYPEHLFLGVLTQSDERVARVMNSVALDMQALRAQAAEIFGVQSNAEGNDLPLSGEALHCIEWAFAFALQRHSELIYPEHLLLGVLRHPRIQPLLVLLSSSEDALPAPLRELIGPAYTSYIDQLVRSRVREQSVVGFDKNSPLRVLRTFERPTITFQDIRGFDVAKRDLREVVQFLKKPEIFQSSKRGYLYGVLLVGHPCTDRTLLVKATAGEAVVPLISLSISALVEMLADIDSGTQSIEDFDLPVDEYNLLKSSEPRQRARDMISHVFSQAKEASPCVLLIDNLDAVQRLATAQEREQCFKQLVVEMDGLDYHPPMAVIATTSQVDALDQALLHPGRFDRQVVISSSFIAQLAAQTKLCLSCTYEVLSTWKYCIYCGASLAQVCPNCGTLFMQVEGARYCFECGTQWGSIKQA